MLIFRRICVNRASETEFVICPGVSFEELAAELFLLIRTELDLADSLKIRACLGFDRFAVHIELFLGAVDDADISPVGRIIPCDDDYYAELCDIGLRACILLYGILDECVFAAQNGIGYAVFPEPLCGLCRFRCRFTFTGYVLVGDLVLAEKRMELNRLYRT